MKHTATQGKGETGSSTGNHGAQFTGVRDSRNRRVPGLYVRNGRYYGQLWVDREDGSKTARKFPLLNADGEPVKALLDAKEAMEVLRNTRRENALPTTRHKPSLARYIETYFAKAEVFGKKPGILENERQSPKRWVAHLGEVRIDPITTPMVSSFKDQRLRGGTNPRTVNLDQIALRNVLKWAREDGYLGELPGLKKLKQAESPKRPLLTPAEFDRLLAAVPAACEKNAVQVADYLRFLAYSGSREQEALHVRWEDVDLEGGRVTIL